MKAIAAIFLATFAGCGVVAQFVQPSAGGSGTGTVNSGTAGNFASYATTGTAVSDSTKAVPTGAVVGDTDTQTLTNKSIVATQLTGTIAAARMPAFTGDITTSAGAVATTLATVNSNVGSFGSTTVVPIPTVNAKGLVTAVSTANIAFPVTLNLGGAISLPSGSPIASNTCATTVTATATGVTSADVPFLGWNNDPTAVTGYAPITSGWLRTDAWFTANTLNVRVCNPTTASITPSAVTVNWRVLH